MASVTPPRASSSFRPDRARRSRKRIRVCMIAYSYYESDNRVMRYAETLAACNTHVDVVATRKKGGQRAYTTSNGVHVYAIQKRVRDEKGQWDYLFRILKFLFASAWFVATKHISKRYDLVH